MTFGIICGLKDVSETEKETQGMETVCVCIKRKKKIRKKMILPLPTYRNKSDPIDFI